MAKFLCKECKSGIVTKIENSEVERAFCKETKQYQTGKVIECSALNSRKIPKKKESKE